MKRLVALASAFLLSCSPAATANAAPATPQMRFALELANDHWGGPPPLCTSIDFQILDPLPEQRLGEATMPSEPEPCILYLDRSLASGTVFLHMCAVVFHEDGHLHGLGHSSNPRAIMYPTIDFVPSACWHAGLWLINHPRTLNER